MTVLPFPDIDAVAALVDPTAMDDACLDTLDALIAAADRASGDCDAEISEHGYLHPSGAWRGVAVHTMGERV